VPWSCGENPANEQIRKGNPGDLPERISKGDSNMHDNTAKWLFETSAIRVCPENKPFWYTSGRIGPFYINTHFLFGSEEKANALLKRIDELVADKINCSRQIEAMILDNLDGNSIFRGVINAMVAKIESVIDVSTVDGISGGERRDWFFSLAVAHRLKKPHLTLFKDMDAVLYAGRFLPASPNLPAPGSAVTLKALPGMRFLHVADLITTASSYERSWVPIVRKLGAEMPWSMVVVDRLQGGNECLASLGVESFALTEIRPSLFEAAVKDGVLDASRLGLVLDYMADPEGSMTKFVTEHPEFIEAALAGDEKTAVRARLCLENDYYPVDRMNAAITDADPAAADVLDVPDVRKRR
jgi:orotate phosphoribosyltransferase